ncbi:hypothetical protein Tco_0071525 [Tanacetum coccineum]
MAITRDGDAGQSLRFNLSSVINYEVNACIIHRTLKLSFGLLGDNVPLTWRGKWWYHYSRWLLEITNVPLMIKVEGLNAGHSGSSARPRKDRLLREAGNHYLQMSLGIHTIPGKSRRNQDMPGSSKCFWETMFKKTANNFIFEVRAMTVLGQMAHRVASITLNSARFCDAECISYTRDVVVGVDVTVVLVIESSSVSLRFRGSKIPFNTSRQSPDENFHHFLRKSDTIVELKTHELIFVADTFFRLTRSKFYCLLVFCDMFSNLSIGGNLSVQLQIVKFLLYDYPAHFQDLPILSLYVINNAGRERVHLDDSKFPQFAPLDVPDLSFESFLLSQFYEV